MKSMIILKGLAKIEKLKWVEKEGLQDFFLDINVLRKLYSSPYLITPFRGILSKSFGDTVLLEFLKILITRLSKGCLVVIDLENENIKILETLAFIFGYEVFYVIQVIPQNYVTKQNQYCLPYYPMKKKEDLKKEVVNFMSQQFSDKQVISNYRDVELYWEKKCKTENYRSLGKKPKGILHISDIHSNYSLYKKLPSPEQYTLRIFYGDYIDGSEMAGSRKMIDEILWSPEDSNTIWLEGNHELRLRKQLGMIMLGSGSRNQELKNYLYQSLPEDYRNITYDEFSDITIEQSREYLRRLNSRLSIFTILDYSGIKYICTHSGIKYIEQISPKYIGNAIYGSRDINRVDRDFASHTTKTNYWSVHAHCKYYGDWNVHKYRNVINLDPPSNEEIIYAEHNKTEWKICQLEK